MIQARARQFAVLADPTRLTLLTCIKAAGPISVSDLAAATGINDATVSQTLRHLRASQTVIAERDGRVVRYRLASTPIAELLAAPSIVDYELDRSVARIYLNRPHRLTWWSPSWPRAWSRRSPGLRRRRQAARVAGAGRAFCSGYDLKEPPVTDPAAARRQADGIQDVTRAIRRFAGPVVAAVHGYALGAGCEFRARLRPGGGGRGHLVRVPRGIGGAERDRGISRLLPPPVGPVLAKELVLLGQRFDVARARQLGLVNQVCPAGEHERAAAGLAERLRELPPLALGLAKQALDRGADCALEEAMAAEADFAALTMPGQVSND